MFDHLLHQMAQIGPNKARDMMGRPEGTKAHHATPWKKYILLSSSHLFECLLYGWSKSMLHYTSLRAVPYMTGISLLWLPHVSVSRRTMPCWAGSPCLCKAPGTARPKVMSYGASGYRARVHMYSYKLTIFKPLIYPVDPLI